MSITEASWYQMMGLSKIFLRNFLIGCFTLLIGTVAVLSVLLKESIDKRLEAEQLFNERVAKILRDCDEMKEIKNKEYINLLKEAVHNQGQINREIKALKSYSK